MSETVTSSPKELHSRSVDCAPQEALLFLTQALPGIPASEVWGLIEQMHAFVFAGPDIQELAGLINQDSIVKYGLRGRLFWEKGQIEWRSLDPNLVRVVVNTETPPDFINENGLDFYGTNEQIWAEDTGLIMWGTSNKDGCFFESRVQGPDDITYPVAMIQKAQKLGIGSWPMLKIRTYCDENGHALAWRFVGRKLKGEP